MKPTEATAKLLLTISKGTTEDRVERLALSLSSMPERDLFVIRTGMHT
jgi:hypothetical protein